MTVLITGGAGYIGSHTVVELLNRDYNLVVIDNFSNSQRDVLQRIERITGKTIIFYEREMLEEKELDGIFKQHKIDSVIHFAGFKSVGESVADPVKYYKNNLISTINLCECMTKHNVKKLVFSSSATVYGENNISPLTEELGLSTMNPYGTTKLIIENFLRELYVADPAWGISILRYFNPIGAHESGLIGENPNGIPNNLMPYITQVAVGKRACLSVYGDDYDTVDGTGVRDYIHVTDLAKGHVKALEKLMGSSGCDAYNLGTGNGYSVLEVVANFEKANHMKIPVKVVERRKGDVATCFADADKALVELGWEAEKSLEDMCRDSWRWQMSNPEGY